MHQQVVQHAGQRIRGPQQWERLQRVTVNGRHGKIVGVGGFQVRFDGDPRGAVNPWVPVRDIRRCTYASNYNLRPRR